MWQQRFLPLRRRRPTCNTCNNNKSGSERTLIRGNEINCGEREGARETENKEQMGSHKRGKLASYLHQLFCSPQFCKKRESVLPIRENFKRKCNTSNTRKNFSKEVWVWSQFSFSHDVGLLPYKASKNTVKDRAIDSISGQSNFVSNERELYFRWLWSNEPSFFSLVLRVWPLSCNATIEK